MGKRQVLAVSPRREIRALRVHVVAVLVKPQVGDDVGGKQRYHVGQRGDGV